MLSAKQVMKVHLVVKVTKVFLDKKVILFLVKVTLKWSIMFYTLSKPGGQVVTQFIL